MSGDSGSTQGQKPKPLEGIKVVDAATLFAGPLMATILGDFGAEVIKIEHPTKGDPVRTHGDSKDGIGLWWKMISRNKRAVTLNLGHEAGQELLCELVKSADVLIENFRPGTLERWNIGWDRLSAINPKLILVRTTGFGQFGPYANRPGFGTLAEAMSGFASITGQPDGPPTLPPFGLADGIAGLAGANAVMFALYHRDVRGGKGQFIDLALIEPILTISRGPAYDLRSTRQDHQAERQPVDEQRPPQYIHNEGRPLGRHLDQRPGDSRASDANGRSSRGDRRALVQERGRARQTRR